MDENKELIISEENHADEFHDYSDEILKIIRETSDREQLGILLSAYHDNDIAEVLELLSKEERKILYDSLGDERTSDIFAYLDEVEKYIEELDVNDAADILEEMDADDAIDILEELDEEKAQELIQLFEPEAKEDIELIKSYDDDQFGSIMTTNFIMVKRNMTVKQTMKTLISQAADNDNISTLYVVNEDDSFYGALELKELITSREGDDLEYKIITSYPFVYDDELISENLNNIKDYSEDSIPVLDRDNNHILGVITAQDIAEAVDEEIGEDYAKLAGLINEEELDEPLLMSIRKRLPWLIALLLLGLVVSSVVGVFEGVVQQVALAVCFQSLVLDMAGNTGTQSLAVTIRVLSDDELNKNNTRRFIFKEMRVGLTNGCILGLMSFILLGTYIYVFKSHDLDFSFAVSACVGISLWCAMIISSLLGTSIPMFLQKIGIDPAVASGPLITTINDLIAVCTYYGLVWLFLIEIFKIV